MRVDDLACMPVGGSVDVAGCRWVKGDVGWSPEGEEGLEPVTPVELAAIARRWDEGERWWLTWGYQLIHGPLDHRPGVDEAALSGCRAVLARG